MIVAPSACVHKSGIICQGVREDHQTLLSSHGARKLLCVQLNAKIFFGTASVMFSSC